MKLLLGMNISPTWVSFLAQQGIEAVHWSSFGDPRARDVLVMDWARQNNCVVFTHDLDFSALLANTALGGPSVVQVRTHDVLPAAIGKVVVQVLREHHESLEQGAIVSIDEVTSRVRILPIRKTEG